MFVFVFVFVFATFLKSENNLAHKKNIRLFVTFVVIFVFFFPPYKKVFITTVCAAMENTGHQFVNTVGFLSGIREMTMLSKSLPRGIKVHRGFLDLRGSALRCLKTYSSHPITFKF